MNKFTQLQKECGLSNQGAAHLFKVRVDTIKNWRYERAAVPDLVMAQLEQLQRAVRIIFQTEA